MKLNIGYIERDKRYIEKNPYWTSKKIAAEVFTNCSYTNPVFIVSASLVGSRTNYVYCDDFNRYYYVTDITQDGARAFLHCHVDVLMSNQDALLGLSANIARCEKRKSKDSAGKTIVGYDPLYADSKVLTRVGRRVHYYNCGTTPFNTTGTGRPVILTVTGGDSNESQ